MLMGLNDFLALAKTPEEEEEIRQDFLRMRRMRRKMTDDDIDYSDIPAITDGSHFRPAKPYVDAMRARNLKHEQERNAHAL